MSGRRNDLVLDLALYLGRLCNIAFLIKNYKMLKKKFSNNNILNVTIQTLVRLTVRIMIIG